MKKLAAAFILGIVSLVTVGGCGGGTSSGTKAACGMWSGADRTHGKSLQVTYRDTLRAMISDSDDAKVKDAAQQLLSTTNFFTEWKPVIAAEARLDGACAAAT